MDKSTIGLIGLAVMGENLALNVAHHGFPISVFNRTAERTRHLAERRARGTAIHPTYSIPELLDSLERPRRVLLMVQAGAPVSCRGSASRKQTVAATAQRTSDSASIRVRRRGTDADPTGPAWAE